MSDDEAERIEHRRERDLTIQEVVDDLVRRHAGEPPAGLRRLLAERLAERGVSGLPEPVLDAMATSAAAGNPYVVSSFTEDVAAVPQPADPVDDEVID